MNEQGKILIYSGTTEGRQLAECLSRAQLSCIVCVATEYGRLTMPPLPGVEVREGRLQAEQMRALVQEENICAVVDATHPYAAEVTENIKESVRAFGQAERPVPYLRPRRERSADFLYVGTDVKGCCNAACAPRGGQGENSLPGWREQGGVSWFADHASCAAALAETRGNILLTTGSKELAAYCAAIDKERIYVRILPGKESLEACERNGIAGKQIIAMQGPFSVELNEALIRQYEIAYLVSKESGAAGGFPEKLAAVERTGIHAFVVGRPPEAEGDSFDEVVVKLEELTGRQIADPALGRAIQIALIGVGMGSIGTMTIEAKTALEQAEYVYGAQRLLDGVPAVCHPKPYYRAADILPELEKLERARVAILFSGDTGFYSGCRSMRRELRQAGYEDIRVYPGVSSVACLAAACGESWQDAAILSIHGRGGADQWAAEVIDSVRYREKTFLLVSSVQDLRVLGQLLQENQLSHCTVTVGYQLSYPQERVQELTPQECLALTAEGFYTCLIRNPSARERPVTQGIPDGAFVRGQIPMTKEEVRVVAISKLHLTEKSVVYDIGGGTGSIAVEIAARNAGILVYAIERRPAAVDLIRQNCKKHRTANVQIVESEAPDALGGLRMPTHVFIGGSGGRLAEILQSLYRSNPKLRVVLTAVSLETIAEISGIENRFPIKDLEIIQVQTSRARQIGNSRLMQAENPVYIASFSFDGK